MLVRVLPVFLLLFASAAAAPVGGLEHVANVAIPEGGDVAFHGDYAYTTALQGTFVIDVRNPEAPVLVASIPCAGRDVGALETNGRVLLTISFQRFDGGFPDADDGCPDPAPTGGIRVIDVTDPAQPIIGPMVPLVLGSHTNTPYGDTGLVYNSAYNLFFNNEPVNPEYDTLQPALHHRVEILDVSGFWDAHVVTEYHLPATSAAPGCHDMLAEPERDRVFCAGGTETMLFDTTDPLAPSVVWTLHNPAITFHHSAATARDGSLLVVGDEWAGALTPGGCLQRGNLPQGAAWFYDVSGATPRLLGHWAPDVATTGTCTVHEFNVIPGEDRLVGSLWTGGSFMVDFTDPTAPAVVDIQTPFVANTWATYARDGYAFSGDLTRGFDVWRVV